MVLFTVLSVCLLAQFKLKQSNLMAVKDEMVQLANLLDTVRNSTILRMAFPSAFKTLIY